MPNNPHLTGDTRIFVLSPALKIVTRSLLKLPATFPIFLY